MGSTKRISSRTRLRRFLLFVALTFSFGGFSVYAAVVVPVGSSVLDSTSQGFVTQKVTHFLNAFSVVTLLLLLWEVLEERRGRGPKANRTLATLFIVLSCCCIALLQLHPRLDAMLAPESFSVERPTLFYRLHQVYLWVSTVQWLASLALIWVLVSTWHAADENAVSASP